MESGKKYVMFVDETGTPKGNTQFNLTGVLMEYKYSIDADETGLPCELKRRLQAFKRDVFKTEHIPLHLKEILKAEHQRNFKSGTSLRKRRWNHD